MEERLHEWKYITITAIFIIDFFLVIFSYFSLWFVVLLPINIVKFHIISSMGKKRNEPVLSEKILPAELKEVVTVFDVLYARLGTEVEKVETANDRFWRIVQNFPLSIAMYYPSTGIVEYINPEFTKVFGYEINEIPDIYEWCPMLYPDPVHEDVAIPPNDVRVLCKTGEYKIVEVGGVIVGDSVIYFFNDVSERRMAELDIKKYQNQLRELNAHILDAKEEERKSIAQEIHDELGQILTVARIDLIALREDFNDTKEHRIEHIDNLKNTIEKASEMARNISENIRPGMLDLLGLIPAIELHCRKMELSSNIDINLSVSHTDKIKINDRVAITAFRVVQEALTNVIRYAHATHVEVDIMHIKRNSELLISIADDGVGLPADFEERKQGFGLLGMRERSEILGGNISIESEPGRGVRLEVSLPLNGGEL